MKTEDVPEVWLRGPVEGILPELQPVAHALLQIREDVERVRQLRPGLLWRSVYNAAPLGFHLKHLAGSTERLHAYATGNQLDESLRRAMADEKQPDANATPDILVARVQQVLDRILVFLRTIQQEELHLPREVGRARLPSTTLGLLFHIAEHGQRHMGQIITTMKIVEHLAPEATDAGG